MPSSALRMCRENAREREKGSERKRVVHSATATYFQNENETNEQTAPEKKNATYNPHTHPPESPKNEDGNKNSTSFEHTTQAPRTV